mgnify:CR=1 FL=1
MPGEACDGMDVLAVRDCVGARRARARASKVADLVRGADRTGSAATRCGTPRPRCTAPKDEVEHEKQRDPIVGLRERLHAARPARRRPGCRRLAGLGWRPASTTAVAFADALPEPPAEWLTADVYA